MGLRAGGAGLEAQVITALRERRYRDPLNHREQPQRTILNDRPSSLSTQPSYSDLLCAAATPAHSEIVAPPFQPRLTINVDSMTETFARAKIRKPEVTTCKWEGTTPNSTEYHRAARLMVITGTLGIRSHWPFQEDDGT
ncbi:hypothetical protein HYFRA_00006500 [Hymenoscyphus fraxineus]|uniref:Uncharacterized protein n=1 Tax=Hymenoscyphus fraxineus TaxID=746836 RepID=A0A9N9KT49_9HELO|nr:hypothetical protein HYFRA_00006500 [Hymenoscyphus fraxineus]